MGDITLSSTTASALNTLDRASRNNRNAETAMVTGEKSVQNISPNAAAQSQSAKDAIGFAKTTAIRSVQATSAAQAIIIAITEGIQILTEAIVVAASEVNDLNPTATKGHTDTVFQSHLSAFEQLMSRIEWNGVNILTGVGSDLQFQLGEKSSDLLIITPPDLTLNTLSLSGIDVTDTANATTAEASIKDALAELYNELGAISGKKQDIDSITERNELDVSHLIEKQSNLIEADIPEELANAKQYEAQMDIIYGRITKMLDTLKRDVELFRER